MSSMEDTRCVARFPLPERAHCPAVGCVTGRHIPLPSPSWLASVVESLLARGHPSWDSPCSDFDLMQDNLDGQY